MSDITSDNFNIVQYMIRQKQNYDAPYYATNEIRYIQTDMDHFPYSRYFRGVYNVNKPVIFERETGYRPTNNSCYRKIVPVVRIEPNMCWENACSTVRPCANKQKDDPNVCAQNFVIPP
jgi:hypothetical protein